MTAILNELENGSNKIASITPEIKQILHQSILHYLHRSGFSKTLKRFQSEAQIQSDTWKTSSDNLEEIYCKYIDSAKKDGNNVGIAEEKTTTSKKEKKKKTTSVESEKSGEIPEEENVVAESETKPKKKKKNKQELASCVETEEEKKGVDDTTEEEEKKTSKKRKRLLSENEHQPADVETDQKTIEASQEDKVDEKKSAKKQRNGSAEPKTVNAFQRVKIDQVEFAHEKLQDNSYWAKDGADIGYGAKAQEVLGQVRGRDFRHEKTKKKRGSYRGGQIDLQSHSIKFDYSDEE